jgi:MFS family permease
VFSKIAVLARAKARLLTVVGGPARLQIILVLAAILGLNLADNGTVSAISAQLKDTFRIDNTEFGLLLAVTSFAGAIATLPMGILADRMRRRTILMVVVPLWVVVMTVSGTATSYVYLLCCRVALGAVEAAAWPCIASLTGDFFPVRERAGIYGLVLAGELIGGDRLFHFGGGGEFRLLALVLLRHGRFDPAACLDRMALPSGAGPRRSELA